VHRSTNTIMNGQRVESLAVSASSLVPCALWLVPGDTCQPFARLSVRFGNSLLPLTDSYTANQIPLARCRSDDIFSVSAMLTLCCHGNANNQSIVLDIDLGYQIDIFNKIT